MARTTLVEVCLDSVESAVTAAETGAERVELCDDLVEGGTTPSAGMIEVIRERVDLGLQVMIRPRGGDFVYSKDEQAVMARDVEIARERGADGVVLGLLLPDGRIDRDGTARLVERAGPLSVTFHRALDMTRDPLASLETLVELGVDRVLTSGQEADVPAGLGLIRHLVEAARDRLVVMPGCGIDEANARGVVEASGAREIHVALTEPRPSPMRWRNPRIFMGTSPGRPEYERPVTSRQRLERLLASLP